MCPLIIVPLEPLTERYTESWYRNFPRAFTDAGFEVKQIPGIALRDTVGVGTFLDINSTVHYKMHQLQHIASLFHHKEVKPGTVFFFSDIEFWGLECVRLMSQMNEVPVKLCGFLHAASYTKEDAFAVAAPYQQFTEVGWLAALDAVFVGSDYHKRAVLRRRLAPLHAESLQHRIYNTGNPLFPDDYPLFEGVTKRKKVVLTNRFDKEKRPNETMALFARLKERFPDWEFVVTTSRKEFRSNDPQLVHQARWLESQGVLTIKEALTKVQYHLELAEAAIMVSHSIEENYGYCIAEALHYGVLPLLRRGLSHDEFLVGRSDLWFEGPDDAYLRASALMRAFGTPAWPAPPTLDYGGMGRIVIQVKRLAKD